MPSYLVSSNYLFLKMIFCLPTVILLQVTTTTTTTTTTTPSSTTTTTTNNNNNNSNFNYCREKQHKDYFKARIDKTLLNSRCRLWGDRNEMINQFNSIQFRQSQMQYKTTQDWVGKVIHWELCKTLKFDDTNK